MAVSLARFQALIARYLKFHPSESERLEPLVSYLETNPSVVDLFSRANFVGHVTASALVLCRRTGRVVLVKKPAWNNRHLQPGGHVLNDSDASPYDAAVRHLTWRLPQDFVERLQYIQCDYDPLLPLDIDIHAVPLSSQDGEPPHNHFDFRYVFFGDEKSLSLDNDISTKNQPTWYDLDYLKDLQTFQFCLPKLRRLSTPEVRRRRFFAAVVPDTQGVEVSTIAVAHILPDVPEYLRALQSLTDLRAVLAKPRSIDSSVRTVLQNEGFRILHHVRDSAALITEVTQLIEEAPHPVVLLDIGGWFANHLAGFSNAGKGRLIGVIEDTENGLHKYQALNDLPVPVLSVARSPLKEYEDFLIGQSIVYSADSVLRECGSLIQFGTAAVIGYGKVGKSIAHNLALKGVQPSVYDENPMRRLEAYNRQCAVPCWSDLLSQADTVFSATGSRALALVDFRQLKNGCFVFSVTSSDDEFDFSFLHDEYDVEQLTAHVKRYSGSQNYFHLVNDGEAVNFLHGAVVGEFIHLVRAEMLMAIGAVAHSPSGSRNAISELSDADRQRVADAWLNVFVGEVDLLSRRFVAQDGR